MSNRFGWIVVGIALSILPLIAAQQQSSQAPTAAQGRRATVAATDEGIPITDPEVRPAGSAGAAGEEGEATLKGRVGVDAKAAAATPASPTRKRRIISRRRFR